MPSMPSSPTKSTAATDRSTHVRQRTKHADNSSSHKPTKPWRYNTSRILRQEHDDAGPEGLDYYISALTAKIMPVLADIVHSVLSHTYRILRPALTFLVSIWIIAYVAKYLWTTAIASSLAPVCALPGISYLNLPFCFPQRRAGPAEFDELMTVQSSFEDVLSSSSGAVTLPMDMKRSESSLRDLRHVVQFSTLPSRNELTFEFTGFIETARQASADLTRFNSRVGRAVDQVINTNRWTLQVIDGVAEKEASKGSVSRFLAGTLFFPFQSGQVTEKLLMDQYMKHTRAIEEYIAELILEAQALLSILQNLDDRLDVIHGISIRDGVNVQGKRDELFAQLYTWIGGNRASKKKNDNEQYLLAQITSYRKVAWDHVSGTMLKLQSIAAGLEDLRERVAAPEVIGHREDMPLKLHIDNIQLAVDRLDSQRTESRRLENKHQRRALDKNQQLLLP